MAIPPPEVRNSQNLELAARAAELGWVTQGQAEAAIAEARRRAGGGGLGDALEILRERCRLSDIALAAIARDEGAPPPWWAPWRRRAGTWGAPAAELLGRLYGRENRGAGELRRRFAASEAGRDEVLAAMSRFRRPSEIGPDPIAELVDGWLAEGVDLPDAALEAIYLAAPPDRNAATDLLGRLFGRLPVSRLGLAVRLALEAPPSSPPRLAGRWLDETADAPEPLAPVAPLVEARVADPAWRARFVALAEEAAKRRRAPPGSHPLAAVLEPLCRALDAGDPAVAAALGEIGAPPALEALRRALGHALPAVRLAAAVALNRAGDTTGVGALRELLGHIGARRHVRRELAALPPALRPALPEATETEALEDAFLARAVGPFGPLREEPAGLALRATRELPGAGWLSGPVFVHVFDLGAAGCGYLLVSADRGYEHYGVLPSGVDVDAAVEAALGSLPRPVG